jgi:hypothetical protein
MYITIPIIALLVAGPPAAYFAYRSREMGIGFDMSFGKAFKAVRAMREYRQMSGKHYSDRKTMMKYFVKQELLPITNYLPDIEAIRKNGVKIIMAAEERSLQKRRFYAETDLPSGMKPSGRGVIWNEPRSTFCPAG